MEEAGIAVLRYPFTLIAAWLGGLLVAALLLAAGRARHQALGVGIMSVPAWSTLWGILNSLEPLVAGGTVLRAFTTYELSSLYARSLLTDLGYLGAGFLMWARGDRLRNLLSAGPRELAEDLRRAGLPLGRGGEAGSAAVGALLFPLLLGGTIAISVLTADVDALHQGDEGSVWDNMTLFHAVLISLAAAFGEELLYRGFLQGVLGRVAPVPFAILGQAILFGFAHAGYGTWIHVLLPFLFGLASGAVAWRWGIWATITLHFLVDLVAFGVEVQDELPWFGATLALLLLSNAVATLAYAGWWVARRVRGTTGTG